MINNLRIIWAAHLISWAIDALPEVPGAHQALYHLGQAAQALINGMGADD